MDHCIDEKTVNADTVSLYVSALVNLTPDPVISIIFMDRIAMRQANKDKDP